MNDLTTDKLRLIVQTPVLLVASDYDGTLAPLVEDPASAGPYGSCMEVLAALAKLDHTHAAIISGRGRDDLVRLSGVPPGVRLIGSHGAEDEGLQSQLPDAELLNLLGIRLDEIASRGRGLLVERKPLAVALHFRAAESLDANRAVSAALEGPAKIPGVYVRHGSMVVELCISTVDKGSALNRSRYASGATGVIFIGDDLTDEDAFAVLGTGDLGVKVGEEESKAVHRVADVSAVASLLEQLLELRRAWLVSRRLVSLESLSILSDQRTLAVVDRCGRVVWQCVPRLDSSSVFASLLGGDSAGCFEIVPLGQETSRAQHYEGDSLLLKTEWDGVTVTDYLDSSGGRPFQRAGRSDLVRVIEGRCTVTIRFAPRLDFGRAATKLRPHMHGIEVEGSPDPLVLYSEGVVWTIRDDGIHHTAEATVKLNGTPIVLELRSGTSNLRESIVPELERRSQSLRFWAGWAGALTLPVLHAAAVKRSALVIKALCHGPSGAIAAAATTSLPEQLGGVRNWDYRFCWPRDAALSAAALVRLGNTGHAMKLLDWLLGVVDACETPDRLRPIYTVTGRYLPPEAEIGQLAGYGGSRPVRISNAAANQVQLDVFGPIVDLVALLAERGAPISPDHWRLVRAMVQAVEARWREPDHGIWEIRADRRHHVHSKVMCWLTVHRALHVQDLVLGRREAAWERLRDEIQSDVLAHGFSEDAGAFTAAYGSKSIDAAALWVGLSGLVPAHDPRFVRTVETVSRALRRGPVVYRYQEDDGLPGREGGMLICAGWLAEAMHLIGRTDEARELLDALVCLMGPTGIAAEQYCPRHKIALGNIAQAYSHLAIINAAVALSQPTPRSNA